MGPVTLHRFCFASRSLFGFPAVGFSLPHTCSAHVGKVVTSPPSPSSALGGQWPWGPPLEWTPVCRADFQPPLARGRARVHGSRVCPSSRGAPSPALPGSQGPPPGWRAPVSPDQDRRLLLFPEGLCAFSCPLLSPEPLLLTGQLSRLRPQLRFPSSCSLLRDVSS